MVYVCNFTKLYFMLGSRHDPDSEVIINTVADIIINRLCEDHETVQTEE